MGECLACSRDSEEASVTAIGRAARVEQERSEWDQELCVRVCQYFSGMGS